MNYAEHYRRLYESAGPDAVRSQMNDDINEIVMYDVGVTLVDVAEIIKAAHQLNI